MTAPAPPTLSGARSARHALAQHLETTPVIAWIGQGSHATPVMLKCEHRQRTGSFKPRGALWFSLNLTGEERAPGLVTVSAGNHALATAYAARSLGFPATVVLFQGASPYKMAATRDLGARVLVMPDVARAFEEAHRIEREDGAVFIHPFDHPRTVEGAATLTLGLLEQVPDMDCLVMGVGGGGLLSGAALALTGHPDVRLLAVEPESAATLTEALAAGHPVTLPKASTIADGLAAPYVGNLNFDIVKDRVESVALVTDDEIRRGMKTLFADLDLMIEPGGAAAFGAILAGRVDLAGARRPVCVLSGGNVAPDYFRTQIDLVP